MLAAGMQEAGTGSETAIVCLKHMECHFAFRICERFIHGVDLLGDAALICSGVTARTSIVTYCSLTISPQSCSFFFPFPLPPFLGIPLVRARYAQALVRLGLDKYFVRCRIYLFI